MRTAFRLTDHLLHIVLPLLLGIFLYTVRQNVPLPKLMSNHLADGFWAYSFMSALLLIWKRAAPLIWVIIPYSIAVIFELLQYNNSIPGTGDINDIVTYFLFFSIALIINSILKHNYQNQSNDQ